jgi:hypothetical protein
VRRLLGRLAFAVAVALGTMVTAAIVIAVVDIYLTGHSLPSLGEPLVSWPALGVRMSRADAILVVATVGAGIGAWFLGSPRRGEP